MAKQSVTPTKPKAKSAGSAKSPGGKSTDLFAKFKQVRAARKLAMAASKDSDVGGSSGTVQKRKVIAIWQHRALKNKKGGLKTFLATSAL